MKNKKKEPVYFDISASVVKQLGEELVTDEVTAIMELVKNSYDADANWVRIEINTENIYSEPSLFYKNKAGYIVIEDDGFGMSESDIRNGWLKISFSKKRKMRKEGILTPKKRMPLGEKGLGRLSTQKLGHKLEMFTGKEKSESLNHVAFSWRDFTQNITLKDVKVTLDKVPRTNNSFSTRLIISELNAPNVWRGSSVDKIKGQLSQLIFPYKDKRPFNVYLKINGKNISLDEINENAKKFSTSSFDFDFKNKTLKINGTVKFLKLRGGNQPINKENLDKLVLVDNGKAFFDFLTDKQSNKKYFLNDIEYDGKEGCLLKITKKFNLNDVSNLSFIENKKFANPGSFVGEIDDFSFNPTDAVESVFDDFAQFKTIIQNQVGVRIYRDGFGIKPFGLVKKEEGKIKAEDWLGLGSGQTSGGSFYGLRPNNVIGFVSLSAKENYLLKEKTDREGFMDDAYSKNFFLIMDTFVSYINKSLEKIRRSYNDYKKVNAEKEGGITSIKAGLQTLRKAGNQSKNLSNNARKSETGLKSVSVEVKKVRSKTDTLFASNQENELAPLIKRVDEQLDKAKELVETLNKLLLETTKLNSLADILEPTIEGLENQLNEFSELAGLGMTAEALSHEIAQIADRLALEADKTFKNLKRENISKAQIFSFVEFVRSVVSTLRKQLSHLAPSLKYVREKSDVLELNEFIGELTNYYDNRFSNNVILFEVHESSKDFKIKFNKGKLTQIFDNLILNSEYWLKDFKKKNENFLPKLTIKLSPPFVQLFDNGRGINQQDSELIFQPFITSKPKGEGRGLGLFIIDQFLSAEGCSIFLRADLNNQNNKYIFQIDFNNAIYG